MTPILPPTPLPPDPFWLDFTGFVPIAPSAEWPDFIGYVPPVEQEAARSRDEKADDRPSKRGRL